jgi:hypothetical protein
MSSRVNTPSTSARRFTGSPSRRGRLVQCRRYVLWTGRHHRPSRTMKRFSRATARTKRAVLTLRDRLLGSVKRALLYPVSCASNGVTVRAYASPRTDSGDGFRKHPSRRVFPLAAYRETRKPCPDPPPISPAPTTAGEEVRAEANEDLGRAR